ncbi:MAG: calcium-binding protein, partial [Magnetococcales bacterium]|nr:calcium-binding protein [Magnetococcales bacterium]
RWKGWRVGNLRPTFADGTVWDQTTLHSLGLSIYGTAAADTLVGTNEFNTIYGMAGDDILGGDQGSADYNGYTSINSVYRGNDYHGNTGNDLLKGTAYSDRYYFDSGDGQDVIQEYSTNYSTATDSDQIVLGTGIVANDLQLTKTSTDLIINFANSTDKLTLKNWYVGDNYRVESMTFSNGTAWDQATLHRMGYSSYGTAASDTLVGTNEFDAIYGQDGNDILGGDQTSSDYTGYSLLNGVYRGNDYHGGLGNDTLRGTNYSDRYYFSAGDGQDSITDYSTATSGDTSNSDRVIFNGTIQPSNITFKKEANDLLISYGTADSVRIVNWDAGVGNQVETIESGDHSTLLNNQVDLLIQDMAAFSTSHGGISWADALNQYQSETQAILTSHWRPAA